MSRFIESALNLITIEQEQTYDFINISPDLIKHAGFTEKNTRHYYRSRLKMWYWGGSLHQQQTRQERSKLKSDRNMTSKQLAC